MIQNMILANKRNVGRRNSLMKILRNNFKKHITIIKEKKLKFIDNYSLLFKKFNIY